MPVAGATGINQKPPKPNQHEIGNSKVTSMVLHCID